MLALRHAGALATAALLSSIAATAQTALFLSPDRFETQPGQALLLRVQAGHAEDAANAPWPKDRLRRLFIRGAGTQQNFDTLDPDNATPDAVKLTMPPPDAAQIGLDLKPEVSKVPTAEFHAFAAKVAPQTKLDENAALGPNAFVRVRRIESAKTIVRVSAPGETRSPSATAMSKSGQAVELRLMTDPTATRVGADVALRFHVDGTPHEGATIHAFSAGSGNTVSMTSGASGFAHFRLAQAGVWRIEAHALAPLRDDPDADFVLHTATLTFEATEGGK